MKKIIVATDFSPAACNAAKYAAQMAIAINADLILLHVYGIPVVYSEVPVAVNTEEVWKVAEENMNDLQLQLKSLTNRVLQIEKVIRMGSFYHELKIVCEHVEPYTVVMGCQGTSATEQLVFGSHAVHAMKHLAWPLITVPLHSVFSTVKKIALVCDLYRAADDTPIDEIKMLVHDFEAELHVLHIGKERVFDPNTVFQPNMLLNILEDLRPIYDFISNVNTDEDILAFAEGNNIDLLLIVPKRYSFLETLMRISHTRYFVLHSHVPIMALHAVH